MARPRKQIDEKAIERAAAIGCTLPEIAAVCGVSQDTIERRRAEDEGFAECLKRGRERGKRSLRRMQWKAAKSGNVTMLIWLGKQMLGQADKVQHTGKDGGPIETNTTHAIDYDQLRKDLEAFAGGRPAGGRVSANGNGQPVHPDNAN